MTKGKYAAKAANRRAELEAAGNLADYQAKVAKLTAENKRLAARMIEKDRAHSQETRRLKAERNEGVAPALRVLEGENKRLKERLDLAERETKRVRDTWQRAAGRLVDHFREAHGMTNLEAIEAGARIVTPDGGPITVADNHELRFARNARLAEAEHVGGSGLPSLEGDAPQSEVDRVRALQRARGERR